MNSNFRQKPIYLKETENESVFSMVSRALKRITCQTLKLQTRLCLQIEGVCRIVHKNLAYISTINRNTFPFDERAFHGTLQ